MSDNSHSEISANGFYVARSANYVNYVRAINPAEARELFAASLFRAKQREEIATIRIQAALPSEIQGFDAPAVSLGPTSVYSIPQRHDYAPTFSSSPEGYEYAENQKLIARLTRAEAVQQELSCAISERPRQQESEGMSW